MFPTTIDLATNSPELAGITLYVYTHMYEHGLLSMNIFCEYLGRERDRRSAINVVNSGV